MGHLCEDIKGFYVIYLHLIQPPSQNKPASLFSYTWASHSGMLTTYFNYV